MAFPAGGRWRPFVGDDGDAAETFLLTEEGENVAPATAADHAEDDAAFRDLFAQGYGRLSPKWRRALGAAGILAGALLAVSLAGAGGNARGMLRMVSVDGRGQDHVVRDYETAGQIQQFNFSQGMIQWAISGNEPQEKLCLDVSYGKGMRGTPVQAWRCWHLNANQQFIYGFRFGTIRFALLPQWCLSAPYGNITYLHLAECNETRPEMNWVLPENGMGAIRWAKDPDQCVKMNTAVMNYTDTRQGEAYGRLGSVLKKEFSGDDVLSLQHNTIEFGSCRGQKEYASAEHKGALVGPEMIWMVLGNMRKYDWSKQPQPLNGQYGYLSEFWISPLEQRMRIDQMKDTYTIHEFQFYLAFQGFSSPPDTKSGSWKCAVEDRLVEKETIENGTAYIKSFGGRSWLYLHAQSVDHGDSKMKGGFQQIDQQLVTERISHKLFEIYSAGAETSSASTQYAQQCGCMVSEKMLHGGDVGVSPLMSMVHINSAWAIRTVKQWAEFARAMGFDGIHWETEGSLGEPQDHDAHTDIPGFLRAAVPFLQEMNLTQTLNFVDGFGWDSSLLYQPRHIAFKYWELWSLPQTEHYFWATVGYDHPSGTGFVMACYPGFTQRHCCLHNERQNAGQFGVWPIDLAIKRWRLAHQSGGSYVFIGDGHRHLQGPFLPDSTFLSESDVGKIQTEVGVRPPPV